MITMSIFTMFLFAPLIALMIYVIVKLMSHFPF